MTLGKTRYRMHKSKAHPSEYPGQGPATIQQAYEELSAQSFAVWIRMHGEHQAMETGRSALAKILKYSVRRFSDLLNELERKGYVSFVRRPGAEPDGVILNRRCIIKATSGMVRISSVVGDAPDHNKPNLVTQTSYPRTVRINNVLASIAARAEDWRCKFVTEDDYQQGPEVSGVFDAPEVPTKTTGRGDYRGVGEPTTESSTGVELELVPELASLAPATRRKLDLSKMREAHEKVQARSKANNTEHRANRERLRALTGGQDFSALDQTGRPIVSFDPSHPKRGDIIRALRRAPADAYRRHMIHKLGVEFSRIYMRYRRDAERRLTKKSYSIYEVQGKEHKLCEQAAVLCIYKGVTPRQVLEFWDTNIRNYTNNSLLIPPLSLLASASSIDRVATSAIGTPARRVKPTAERPIRATDRNTFSGTDGLDIRLRPGLTRVQFDTTMFNDRYLLTIQHNAIAIAKGRSIFMSEGRVRDMVMWAVKNLYQDGGDDAEG
jgi:hypothetical protein